MRIKELYLKNFGKFCEEHFYIQDGVNVIYGENEFGKSTLYAFIRAMLFGLERGRGKAAAKDDFSRFEPWDDPGRYAGVMRFSCGGRNFRLERSFDRFTRHASLVCEDDGEELSAEHGDLDILLGEIAPSVFDNTAAVGQLQAKPGQALADSLKNYAANYYETGGGGFDLGAAFAALKEKKKETDRALKEKEEERENRRRKLLHECGYLERDMEKLRSDFAELREKAERGIQEKRILEKQTLEKRLNDKTEDQETKRRDSGKGAGARSFMTGGAAGIFAGTAGLLWARFLGGQEWFAGSMPVMVISGLILGAGIVLLLSGLRTFWTKRAEKNADGPENISERTEGDTGGLREQTGRCEEYLNRIAGEQHRVQAEWKEKQVRLENIREQAEEIEPDEEERALLMKLQAIAVAVERLEEAAGTVSRQTTGMLERRASDIFSEITEGKYIGLAVDERLEISVWDGIRRIPAQRLSRGTLEQIYFSLRMSAAELLQEEPLPLILDDTFAFYDDKRLESVLKWLSRQGRQVIIFTCQKREEDMLGRIRTR